MTLGHSCYLLGLVFGSWGLASCPLGACSFPQRLSGPVLHIVQVGGQGRGRIQVCCTPAPWLLARKRGHPRTKCKQEGVMQATWEPEGRSVSHTDWKLFLHCQLSWVESFPLSRRLLESGPGSREDTALWRSPMTPMDTPFPVIPKKRISGH